MSKLQEKPFTQNRTSSTKNIKFINFLISLGVIFSLLDPDPDCEFGYVSRDPIESAAQIFLSRVAILSYLSRTDD
jgi:hypothetical protein